MSITWEKIDMNTKRFRHIYFELTNICDRHCSFCPPVSRPRRFMPLAEAQNFLRQAAEFTPAVYWHLQGGPLLHPEFELITAFGRKLGLELKLTTNGSHLAEFEDYLLGGNFSQINFSIQSLNEVESAERERVWLDIINFTRRALREQPLLYINFRWWQNTPPDFTLPGAALGIPPEQWLPGAGRRSRRIAGRLYATFDREFNWPGSGAAERPHGETGSCRGLLEHIGILCDGRVVPCCLDAEGNLSLGDLHQTSLVEILSSDFACRIADGFRKGRRIMPQCQNCSYASRFDK